MVSKGLESGARSVGNWRTNQKGSSYSIIEIVKDAENSSGEWRRFTVTQTLDEMPPANAGMENQ